MRPLLFMIQHLQIQLYKVTSDVSDGYESFTPLTAKSLLHLDGHYVKTQCLGSNQLRVKLRPAHRSADFTLAQVQPDAVIHNTKKTCLGTK